MRRVSASNVRLPRQRHCNCFHRSEPKRLRGRRDHAIILGITFLCAILSASSSDGAPVNATAGKSLAPKDGLPKSKFPALKETDAKPQHEPEHAAKPVVTSSVSPFSATTPAALPSSQAGNAALTNSPPSTQNEANPPAESKKKKSPSELFRDARASHRKKYGISGLTELIEWALVFVLIAPGTFPAMSCVILACAAFLRRRSAAFLPVPRSYAPASPSCAEPTSGGDSASEMNENTSARRRNALLEEGNARNGPGATSLQAPLMRPTM